MVRHVRYLLWWHVATRLPSAIMPHVRDRYVLGSDSQRSRVLQLLYRDPESRQDLQIYNRLVTLNYYGNGHYGEGRVHPLELEYHGICGDLSACGDLWLPSFVAGGTESRVDDFLVVDGRESKKRESSYCRYWAGWFIRALVDEGRWFR